jgi:hypothetical protein
MIFPQALCTRIGPLLSVLLGLGCAEPKVKMTEGPREYVSTDYESVLRLWTRSEQFTSLETTDNVLTVTATYESWDFRWAYAVRYAEDYRLTVDQRKALLERSLTETRETHEFFVALYAQRWKWNDLTADQPAWIVRLIDDEGTETAPSDIQSIKKPGRSPTTRTRAPGAALFVSPSPRCAPTAPAPSHPRPAGSACASPAPKATRRSSGK